MAKILISEDGRMAIIETDIYRAAGYFDCTMFMVDRGYRTLEVEIISIREMDDIYQLKEEFGLC